MSEEEKEQPQTEEDFLGILKAEMEWLRDEREKEDEVFQSLWRDGRPVCETEDQANAILKMMAEANNELERIKEQYQARISRVKTKQNKLDFLYRSVLMEFAKENLPKKKKSLVLPHGTLQFRSVKEGVETQNELKLREWVEENLGIDAFNLDRAPILIEVVKEWEKKNEKPAPGRMKREAEEKFYVKFPKHRAE